MKFTFAILALVATSQAILLQKGGIETGDPIPICNGANSSNCTEADEVVKHRRRRPHKQPAPGDSDYKA